MGVSVEMCMNFEQITVNMASDEFHCGCHLVFRQFSVLVFCILSSYKSFKLERITFSSFCFFSPWHFAHCCLSSLFYDTGRGCSAECEYSFCSCLHSLFEHFLYRKNLIWTLKINNFWLGTSDGYVAYHRINLLISNVRQQSVNMPECGSVYLLCLIKQMINIRIWNVIN